MKTKTFVIMIMQLEQNFQEYSPNLPSQQSEYKLGTLIINYSHCDHINKFAHVLKK